MIARLIAEVWWLRLPLASRRISLIGSAGLMDGYAAVSFPWLAALASPTVFVVGFLAGRESWGYDHLFTESLALLLTFVAIGTISGHYGLMFTSGFVIGDFFFFRSEWENPILYVNRDDGFWDHVVSYRIPILVLYLALLLVTVVAPMGAKAVTAQFAIGPRPVRFGVAMVVHAAVSGGFAYLWSQALPVVLRPVFFWSGGNPGLVAVEPAQTNGSAFITVAVVCSLARLLVQVVAATATVPRVRQDLWADSILSASPVTSYYSRLPAVVRSALGAAVITLMMAGLFQTWGEAWLIFGIAVSLALVRTRAIPLPIGRFRRVMARIPMLLRVALGMFIVWRVAVSEIGTGRPVGDDFQPAIVVVAVAMIVFFLLNPGGSEEQDE